MWPYRQFSADLVTITEEILNEKLHFWCSVLNYLRNMNMNIAPCNMRRCYEIQQKSIVEDWN